MKNYYSPLIFILLILLKTQVMFPQWVQTNGPNGGEVHCFAFSDTIIFAGTNGGVWSRQLSDLIHSSQLTLNARVVSFGSVRAGQYRDTTVTISNSGNDTLKISSITSSRSTFTSRPATLNLAPGKSMADTLQFAPAVVGPDSAFVVIQSNSMNSPDTIRVSGVAIPLTGVEAIKEMPTTFGMDQNYPNPFNPSTIIRYSLPNRSNVRIVITNTLGTLSATNYTFSLTNGTLMVFSRVRNLLTCTLV